MNSSSTEIKDIRRFGLIAFLFFGAFCFLGVWRERVILACFFGLLSSLSMGLFLLPARLQPLYSGWMEAARLVGTLTTMLILTLAYYLVITPAALLKRLLSGRPLPTIPDKNASSYWVSRTEPAQPRGRFTKRY